MKKLIVAFMLCGSVSAQAADVAATAGAMSITYLTVGVSGLIHEKLTEENSGLKKETVLVAQDDAALFIATEGEFGHSAALDDVMFILSQDERFSEMSDIELAKLTLLIK